MLWVIMMPLALILSRYTSLEATGVRWAMVAAYAAGTLAYLLYFKSGRWQRKRV